MLIKCCTAIFEIFSWCANTMMPKWITAYFYHSYNCQMCCLGRLVCICWWSWQTEYWFSAKWESGCIGHWWWLSLKQHTGNCYLRLKLNPRNSLSVGNVFVHKNPQKLAICHSTNIYTLHLYKPTPCFPSQP